MTGAITVSGILAGTLHDPAILGCAVGFFLGMLAFFGLAATLWVLYHVHCKYVRFVSTIETLVHAACQHAATVQAVAVEQPQQPRKVTASPGAIAALALLLPPLGSWAIKKVIDWVASSPRGFDVCPGGCAPRPDPMLWEGNLYGLPPVPSPTLMPYRAAPVLSRRAPCRPFDDPFACVFDGPCDPWNILHDEGAKRPKRVRLEGEKKKKKQGKKDEEVWPDVRIVAPPISVAPACDCIPVAAAVSPPPVVVKNDSPCVSPQPRSPLLDVSPKPQVVP